MLFSLLLLVALVFALDFLLALLGLFDLFSIVGLFLQLSSTLIADFFRLVLGFESYSFILVLFLDLICALDHVTKM